MRPVLAWLLFAVVAAEVSQKAWVEDAEGSHDNGYYRSKRDVHVEGPFDEHIRVKRRCGEERHRRSADYVRSPREVHQYEVHESTDDFEGPSHTYEEMLAASANHHPHIYVPAPQYFESDASNPNFDRSANFAPSDAVVSEPVQFKANPAIVASLSAPKSIGVDNPVPIASEPLIQPLKNLAEGDQIEAASGYHSKKGHSHGGGAGHSHGGGHDNLAHHYGAHDGKSSKGYSSNHYLDKGGKGYRTDDLHRKEYEEQDGKKKKFHDNAGHKGSHEEEAFGQRGSNFDQKKGHKKGHKTKGYHNKYHKDEFQKEHKFYDDFHKSGDHHRYGKFNARHKSNESGKKKAHHLNAGHDYTESGKKGYSKKGHVDSDHKGYNGKHGHDEHQHHHEARGSKGGKDGSSRWGYSKKH